MSSLPTGHAPPPIRQLYLEPKGIVCVCAVTVPHRLRYRLAFDHALCRAVLGVFARAVLGWYRRRGRRAGIADGRSGTVTVVQRFGSGLELNVHFHAVGLDGVFAPGVDGMLRFHRLPGPTDTDVARLVTAIARRIGRLLARRGLTVDAEATDPLAAESLALAGLASAAVQGRLALGPRAGARIERLGHDPDAPWVESSRPLQARCDSCDLHAGVTVAGEDRRRLEQLCRYLLRPPIAQDRLTLRPDGTVVVLLKTPWRDGTTHLRFEPLTLLERLASLTPRPRINVYCITASWHPMPPGGPRRSRMPASPGGRSATPPCAKRRSGGAVRAGPSRSRGGAARRGAGGGDGCASVQCSGHPDTRASNSHPIADRPAAGRHAPAALALGRPAPARLCGRRVGMSELRRPDARHRDHRRSPGRAAHPDAPRPPRRFETTTQTTDVAGDVIA
jgi:hypothetical protein